MSSPSPPSGAFSPASPSGTSSKGPADALPDAVEQVGSLPRGDAGRDVDANAVGCIGEVDGVGVQAADEGVTARSTGERVVSRSAGQDVDGFGSSKVVGCHPAGQVFNLEEDALVCSGGLALPPDRRPRSPRIENEAVSVPAPPA